MSSLKRAAFAVALACMFPAVAAEPEQGYGEQAAQVAPVQGNGEVSVDLEGSTPGLTPELFRSTLAPYGDWLASARYGEVWRPRVAVAWRPYYNGSWLWTDEGWYWDSGEPFAWAVYHYGRWVFDPAWGWVWVPGYQWAPAWVAWRFGDDAVGWAPLGPGISVFVTAYPFIDYWWTFVPTAQFVGVPVQRVAYPIGEAHRWFGRTAPAPPRTVAALPRGAAPSPAWGGPARSVIEQRIGRPVIAERRVPSARPGAAVDLERPGARARPEGWGGRREAAPGRAPASERPEVRPIPRREEPRPQLQPAPRREEPRPQFQPAPRREEPRPQFEPAPRREESMPQSQPAPRGGDRGRQDWGGGERGRGRR